MEIGKVPENVLKRSVLKKLGVRRPEVLIHAGVGEDCGILALAKDEAVVLSTDPITGTTKEIGNLAFHITANDLASAGAELVGLLLTILLPPESTEGDLKAIMDPISVQAEKYQVEILGGHTEISPVVNQALVSVTGVGKVKKGRIIQTGGLRPGNELVLTKWIGIEGTSILAAEKEEQLSKRFSSYFLEEAKNFASMLSVIPESMVAIEAGVTAMHDVTEGGIFGALWEMAEASGCGLEVNLKKIPIRQQTVEICEFFNISPYQLISSGSMLIGTEHGTGLVDVLERAGIPASVIGRATEGNDRVVFNEEEKRFLEPPGADELYKALK